MNKRCDELDKDPSSTPEVVGRRSHVCSAAEGCAELRFPQRRSTSSGPCSPCAGGGRRVRLTSLSARRGRRVRLASANPSAAGDEAELFVGEVAHSFESKREFLLLHRYLAGGSRLLCDGLFRRRLLEDTRNIIAAGCRDVPGCRRAGSTTGVRWEVPAGAA